LSRFYVFYFFSVFIVNIQRETISNDTMHRLPRCLSAFHLHFK